ncbi:AAA family ATPase [Actinomadura rugatobispora]|uniref:CpaE family protein n=1 Tax=Actinomadura rugatobispora TaxID=1994 RepID=A0ABW1A7N3_9ACTN|nr:hypothetical protein GCM10010200_017780 [Actinomadura rugatobispora]
MATAPNLVVAGHPDLARKLRNTGRFPAVFDVASATELRALSKSGKVAPPAAFIFAPQFNEDLPEAKVPLLANALAANGFTVLVHAFFTRRGDHFIPAVVASAEPMSMLDLLTTLGALQPDLQPEPPPQLWKALAPPAIETGARPQTANANPPSSGPAQASSSKGHERSETPPAKDGAATAFKTAPAQDVIRRGRVIVIASAKGGVGKTSTTVDLALYTARSLWAAGRGGATVVVDANVQQADVARYLNLTSPTILDLPQAPGELSAQSVRHHLARIPEIGLHALLGPPDPLSADPALISPALYQEIVTVLRGAFDFVFIDTPVAKPHHTTFVDLILPEADAILVPVEPDRVTLEAVHAWLTAITAPDRRVSAEKISLILNRARSDAEYGPEEVAGLLPGWRLAGVLPEDVRRMKTVNANQLVQSRPSPDLEPSLRGILQAASDDPVFSPSR